MGMRQDDVAHMTADVVRLVEPPVETVGANGERLLIRSLNVRLSRDTPTSEWTVREVTGSGTEHMTRRDEWRGVWYTRRGFRMTPELDWNVEEARRIVAADSPAV
ncbi:hypothetical protein ACLUWO_08605 [Pseudoscardovia radai]|uniref:hypothetical protein n=1 Tax=Pseudoscardovia radai TaxID=987066 RepID=UPI003994ABE3